MRSCSLADGVYPVLPTPFDTSGNPDLESLQRLVRHVVDTGAQGMLVLGVMGEAAKLLPAERASAIAAVMESAAGCPVIVGASHPSVAGARALAAAAAASGAAAVLIGPPRVGRAGGDEAIVRYFSEVAEVAELEIVVQDHPASSGVTLSVEVLDRLAREVESVTAVKLEDPPTPLKVTQARAHAPEGFKIFGGLGGVFLLEELRRGANGTMTGFAFPEVLNDVFQAHRRGAADEAEETFFRYLPLIRFEFQESIGLSIRKRIYMRRGIIRHDHVREPAPAIDSRTDDELDELMRWVGLVAEPARGPR